MHNLDLKFNKINENYYINNINDNLKSKIIFN